MPCGPDPAVDRAFQKLLLSGPRLGIDLARCDATLEIGKGDRSFEDRFAEILRPVRVALFARCGEGVVLDHVVGSEQGARERVDARDVRVEEIGPAYALPPQLRVEVEAAGREPARGKYFVQRERELVDRVRELVGVPPVLIVAAVDVDAAEAAERDRARHLVMEAVAGKGGM